MTGVVLHPAAITPTHAGVAVVETETRAGPSTGKESGGSLSTLRPALPCGQRCG